MCRCIPRPANCCTTRMYNRRRNCQQRLELDRLTVP
jgi:hypothetical protein